MEYRKSPFLIGKLSSLYRSYEKLDPIFPYIDEQEKHPFRMLFFIEIIPIKRELPDLVQVKFLIFFRSLRIFYTFN